MRRILSVDPGAERLGWAVIDTPYDELMPEVRASGILGLHREDGEKYQVYKLRLIDYWAIHAPKLLSKHRPTLLVSETQPAVGGGNYIAATQAELAKTAITILQAWAYHSGLTVVQIAGSTVKKAIGGKQDASKAKVRNGVIPHVSPELGLRLKKQSVGKPAVWDESDAIAIGLAHLGLENK